MITFTLSHVIDSHPVARHEYADNRQTYTRFKLGYIPSLHHAISVLKFCVDDIRVWMARNKLNDDKTEFLLAAPKHHIESLMDSGPELVVGNEEIRPSSCVRDLGATFVQLYGHGSTC